METATASVGRWNGFVGEGSVLQLPPEQDAHRLPRAMALPCALLAIQHQRSGVAADGMPVKSSVFTILLWVHRETLVVLGEPGLIREPHVLIVGHQRNVREISLRDGKKETVAFL